MIIGLRLSLFDPSESNWFIIELVDFTIVLSISIRRNLSCHSTAGGFLYIFYIMVHRYRIVSITN